MVLVTEKVFALHEKNVSVGDVLHSSDAREPKCWAILAVKNHRLDEAGTIQLKPFGERGGFPLPLKASRDFCIMLESFWVEKKKLVQAMYHPAWMCITRAVSTARGAGTWGPWPEPGATAITTALAESTSGLHIWCWACLPALGHCAISVSMH